MTRTRPAAARVVAAIAVVPALLAGSVLAAASADATTKTPSGTRTGALGQAKAACSAGQLTDAKSFVGSAITHRLSALARLDTRLATATRVTAAHRAALDGLYASDTSGLRALDAQVQADPTCAAVRSDAQAVVRSFYVFALVVPQSGLTVAADSGLAGATALQRAEPAVKAAIALLPAGSAKTAATAAYADLATQVDLAIGDFDGVGDAVLALTPATYPTHTGVLKAQTGRVASGGKALKAAMVDAQQIAAALG